MCTTGRNTFGNSFHRYEIFSETPGVVVCRQYVDSESCIEETWFS